MSLGMLAAKEKCCMGDIEDACKMLRMADKDFNALVGMEKDSLFADEIRILLEHAKRIIRDKEKNKC